MTTKDKVIQILEENKTQAVSGEKLAQICDVSRAAIWKAVNSLREKGYQIEGTTNGGYVLQNSVDLFSKEGILKELCNAYPQLSEVNIEAFPQIDSTNNYAKKILSECGNLRSIQGTLTAQGKKYHKSIITAETQTAGKGRLGRTFVSPNKTGVYLSLIYAPAGGISEPALITAFSAVAICRVLKKLYNVQPTIKWINDIFINGKKVSGILTEGSANFETGQIESAVIGIGINILDNPEILNPEISKIAGSILGNSTQTINRNQLIANIAGETFKVLEEEPSSVIEEYKSLSFLIGQTIMVHPVIGEWNSVYQAKAIDITEKAGLVVQLNDGSKKVLNSGEVSLHLD